jgi:hypothetical protein
LPAVAYLAVAALVGEAKPGGLGGVTCGIQPGGGSRLASGFCGGHGLGGTLNGTSVLDFIMAWVHLKRITSLLHHINVSCNFNNMIDLVLFCMCSII